MNKRVFNSQVPPRLAKRGIDKRGFPIPYFVTLKDENGEPEFRCIAPEHLAHAIRSNRCWVCGEPLGGLKAFCIGPMCGINRTIADPPSHYDCATFAARNCPFMASPNAKRRATVLPEGHRDAPGIAIKRNPTAVGVWVTKNPEPFRAPGGGVLFNIGDPEKVEWYHAGRRATLAEVKHSVMTGLPLLAEAAMAESPEALVAMIQKAEGFMAYLESSEWPAPLITQ
jgi:hypothetical protein